MPSDPLMTVPTEDPQIALCRDQCLADLKPSDRDLEHGLALHRSYVVIDAYGFSAFAAPDHVMLHDVRQRGVGPDSQAALNIQSRMTRMATDPWQRDRFLDTWRVSGVTCVMRNSGEEGNQVERLLPRLAHNTFVTDTLAEYMCRMISDHHIQQAKAKSKFGFCLTTNGVPISSHFGNVEQALRFIPIFRQLGVRMMHLTYNRRNLLGDGCAEVSNAGLSDLGRHAIDVMNREGVLVDIAHSGERTGIEAARQSSRPVIASHTACRALHRHCRGKSDETCRAIADTGGVIGICAIPAFLGGAGTVTSMLDHIDHVATCVGVEHVAIGTDRPVCIPPGPNDAEFDAPGPSEPMPRFESYWPQGSIGQPQWNQPVMHQSLAWTNWPLFTVGLVQRGYRDEQIRQIVGGNMMRVLAST